MRQRTALINQAQGLLGERGLVAAQSPAVLKRALPKPLRGCEGELTPACQALLLEISQQTEQLEQRIAHAKEWIKVFMRQSPLCKKIAAIDGVGPVTATAKFAATGEAREFKNGRHLATWLGPVPRQYSSDGSCICQESASAVTRTFERC